LFTAVLNIFRHCSFCRGTDSEEEMETRTSRKILTASKRSAPKKCFCQIELLVYNYAALRNGDKFHDLQVETSDGASFDVHFLPLAALAVGAFESYQKSGDAILRLDVSADVFKTILSLAYTGCCEIREGELISLLMAGTSLNIPSLLAHCGQYLLKDLSLFNAVDYYKLSNKYLCQHISAKIEFLIKRNFEDIIQNKSALRLSSEEMASIISDDETSICETKLADFLLRWSKCNGIEDYTFGTVVEFVRFTNIAQEDFFRITNHQEMQNLIGFKVESLLNGKRKHDGPIRTRQTAKKTRRFNVEKTRIPNAVIMTVGGWGSIPPGPCTSIETYDYIADKWEKTDLSLPSNRAYHGLEIIDRKVYVIGGYDSGGFGGPVYHSSIMVLDLETLEWKEKTPMEHKRCYVGTVAIDGQIVAIGGHDGVVRHRSVEVYDPKTNIWTPMPSTITRRSDMATVVHNHVIYTIGGFTGQEVLTSIEILRPNSDSWSFYDYLATPRSGVNAVVLGDKIYVLGGFDGTMRLRTVECFSPGASRGVFHQVPDMIKRRSNFAATVFQGKIYVSGGYSDPTVCDDCEVYCPVSNTWKELPDLNLAKSAIRQLTVTYKDANINHLIN